jgi:transcription factor WhiB
MSLKKTDTERDGVVELLTRVLWKMPKLQGAACRHKAGVFADRHRIPEARAICASCPAFAACRYWAQTQHGLIGVVAGELRGPLVKNDDDEENEYV